MAITPDSIKFQNEKNRDFLDKMVIPEGIKQLQKLFKIDSSGMLPVLGDAADECKFTKDYEIPASIKNEEQETDYILLVDAQYKPGNFYKAKATYCVQRNVFYLNS